jgi:hypothetical protein
MPHKPLMKSAGSHIMNESQPNLSVRVQPNDMVQYVHNLMAAPQLAPLSLGGDTALAQAAQLRWRALNRAFTDPRLGSWMMPQKRDQVHVPAALVAAAGVARLTMEGDEVVFDVPTLLDATLQLCEPAGNA